LAKLTDILNTLTSSKALHDKLAACLAFLHLATWLVIFPSCILILSRLQEMHYSV